MSQVAIQVGTLDLTQTWAQVLPALIAVMQDGNAEGQRIAIAELRRMAQAADEYNQLIKESEPPYKNSNFANDLAECKIFSQPVTHGYTIERGHGREEEGEVWDLSIITDVDGDSTELAKYQYYSREDAEKDIETANDKSLFYFEEL